MLLLLLWEEEENDEEFWWWLWWEEEEKKDCVFEVVMVAGIPPSVSPCCETVPEGRDEDEWWRTRMTLERLLLLLRLLWLGFRIRLGLLGMVGL